MATPPEVVSRGTLPARIGRFKPLRVLGRGGQGVVYLAHDPKLGREVALKTLIRGQQDPKRLLSEARNVARLDHPGIVPLYEIDLTGAIPYLAYQYADGQPLAAYIDRAERLPIHQTLKIGVQLLAAIGYAHGQNILHRDLSPSNVLLDAGLRPRILDFGVSTLISANGADRDIVGTLNYLPPEVVANGPIGPHSDLYSLGVILYELLTGRRLFVADTAHATIYKILNDKVLPPSAFNPAIEGPLDSLLLRALARAPDQRFTTADEMQSALEAFMAAPALAQETAAKGKRSSEVEFLLHRMARKPDFPAISQLVVEINQKSGRPESDDINDLANVILKDFALTSKLLKLVNSAVYGQYGGTITTVSRAVTILGFDAIRIAVLSIAVFENLKNGSQADALKDAACGSFLSAVLGKELARSCPGVNAEEVFIGAMFHRLGKHLAIYYFPDEFAEIKTAIAQRGITEASAVREVLRTNYTELGLAVAQQWNFPDSMQLAMVAPREGKVPPAKTLTMRGAQLAAYANEISETIAQATDARDLYARLKKLADRFDSALQLAPKQMRELVTNAIEVAKDYAKVLSIDLQSSTLFKHVITCLAGASDIPSAVSNTGIDAPSSEPSASPDERRMLLVSAMTDITNALVEQTPVNQIFGMVIEAFYRGIEFSNVFLMLRDPKRHAVQARLGFGLNIDEILPNFGFKTDDATDIFNESLRKAREFVILNTRSEQYAARVPSWCRTLTNPYSVLLFPLVANNVCIGLIYADKRDEQISVSVQELKLLNTLVKQASLAFTQRR